MTKHSYSEDDLRVAISQARSFRQALINLGLSGKGGNYRVIHKAVARYKLDISHFTGQGWNRGQKIGPKRPIQDYLEKGIPIQSHKLRLRLIREGIFEHRCSRCSLETWLSGPIPLELEHINGDHTDNSLSNLRLLCPNCHALTDTYRGKNRKSTILSSELPD